MALTRLTDKTVKSLPTPAKGNTVYWDTGFTGLGLRVTAAGARSYVLNYRTRAGRERRITIGSVPAWKVFAARQEAAELRRRIDAGDDPLGARQELRGAPTVSELLDRFEAEHIALRRPATRRLYVMASRHIRAALGPLKVAAVEFRDIARLHRQVTERHGGVMANRVLAVASKAFAIAIRWGWRSDSPVKGVERNQEHARERYLSEAELARLTATLASWPSRQTAALFTLALLTGCRIGEALAAKWAHFDLEVGRWTRPAGATKQRKLHVVPLSPAAIELLETLPRAGVFLFPGGRPGEHLQHYAKPWRAICQAAHIKGLRVHDLRHSFASTLASGGASLPVIGALLGHSQPATTARYAHLVDGALREATTRVGEVVTRAAKGGKVVPLRGGRA
jgi:integrase